MLLLPVPIFAQYITGVVVDNATGISIPFANYSQQGMDTVMVANIGGEISLDRPDSIFISHPLYESVWWQPKADTSRQIIALQKKQIINATPQSLNAGAEIIKNHHQHLAKTSSMMQDRFYYLSKINMKVFEMPDSNRQALVMKNEFESIEKNKFVFPDKRYNKIVERRFANGDSSWHSYLPTHLFTVSEDQEYLTALDLKFFNPLHPEAAERYDFMLIDSIFYDSTYIQEVYFQPKKGRNFTALTGILYFSGRYSENVAGYFSPFKSYNEEVQLAFYRDLSERSTRYLKNMRIIFRLQNIPNTHRHTMLEYNIANSKPVFETQELSSEKWISMAIFDYQKNSPDDDTWTMSQVVDREKLEYIRKDTVKEKLISTRTLNYLVNIYEGRLGYRMKYFDLKNVFSINKFETLRLGIGLQSHERLSDRFTFGGYVGYGFGDSKVKYGANVGLYADHGKNTLFSMKYKRDLQEPGLVNYLDNQQDLVRKFFTSRMDDYESFEFSLRSRINAYITAAALLNNYSLKPLYAYNYNPTKADSTGQKSFNLSETTLLFNFGTPLSDYPAFQNFIFSDKRLNANLYVNLTKGWKIPGQGQFDYWKINGRLKSKLKLQGDNVLHLVFDGGVMTPNMPYEVNYGGPGTEFKLTGIIINNAFQTMKLYGFFADRYLNSFMYYNFGHILPENKKFKPELAFSLNAGWGKISGDKSIHEQIEVRDYAKGYFETGVIFNNLLRLKLYRYFYGGLGIGTFYGYDPNGGGGSFAIRLSYELGTLM